MITKKIQTKRGFFLGIYKRKLLFFVCLFLVGAGFLYYSKNNNNYQASEEVLNDYLPTSALNVDVNVLKNGEITIDGKKSKYQVSLLRDYDEVRFPVVDKNGNYYSKITIKLTLPEGITGDVHHEILAIHGVGSSSSYIKDASTIVYEANSVSSGATISIVAKMAKGTIKPPLSRLAFNLLEQAKNSFWLLTATILPMITTIFLVIMVAYQYRRQKIEKPTKEISAPPMAIPPAVVGALANQKIGPREIAATLIDLARRGDIFIIDRERGFSFGKGRYDNRLLGFERILLSKIFRDTIKAEQKEIEERFANHLYSKKMSIVTAGIYALATRLGYFKVNPGKIHLKYRLLGIFAFFVAFGGFMVSLSVFTDPPYAIFFWVGMMISALIIAFLAGNMPIRTPIGQEVLTNWLAFQMFLSKEEEFPYSEDNEEIFEKYLPYAIVLNCEAAWARRFLSHNFALPNWFLTEKNGLSIEDFCLTLFPIVSYVGRNLSTIREPGKE